MKRLERIVERVARSPRWLADHDLPGFLRQFVFVNRGYGALPSADIADNQEMFREVYRVKDREDRKRRFRPFVSRFFWLAVYSDVWDGWGTVVIVNAKFVASQSRLVPSQNVISVRAEINQRRCWTELWRLFSAFESYLGSPFSGLALIRTLWELHSSSCERG